jgi:dynein heavy chain
LEDLLQKEVHKDYRLWLTTMPTKAFPVPILQSGIKVTKEPPRGLKANLRDSFSMVMNPEMWEGSRNPTAWKKLLFALTFFHGIVQERRKFGALGWNIAYEWNQSDLGASVKSLRIYAEGFDVVPWTALRYITGVINYGGRVTDFLDSRLLQTILVSFFDPKLLSEELAITADRVYRVPMQVGSLDSVNEYLSALPPYENPAIFGLHRNADITYNKNSSRRQLETVLSVQPRLSGGGGMSLDQQVCEIAEDFERRLPPIIDKADAHEDSYRITESGAMTSLGTILGQEVDVFNKILGKLRSSLRELKRAIKGEVVMNAMLESMFNAFLVGKVPEFWSKGGYLSLKPLASWFEDTIKRVEFLRDWNNNGPPLTYWISGFFFPQGFLTAALQTHSRAHKIPIDELAFRTHVTLMERQDEVDEGPESGVYVHGMFLEGARFNRDINSLDESASGELFTSMPVLWLEPVLRVDLKKEGSYACPLYKTSTRVGELSTTGLSTNFVLSLDLPCGKEHEPSHWVKRGVAMLCMLDD